MIRRGSVVSFVDEKGKKRPAIVLREFDDGSLQLICGSTQPPNSGETDFELIESATRTGKAFDLRADTWFKKTFLAVVQPQKSQVELRSQASCPSWLLVKLDKYL